MFRHRMVAVPRILNINATVLRNTDGSMENLVLVDRTSTSMPDLTPLRTSTNEAEFNAFLVTIADEITKEEVHEMKFLCLELNNNLPRGKLDEIKEPREFVSFLRKRGIISPGDVGFLTWLLGRTGNKRLADMINERGKQIFQFIIITCADSVRSTVFLAR